MNYKRVLLSVCKAISYYTSRQFSFYELVTLKPKSRYPPEALESIPGIGPSMAVDLRGLGINKVSDLKGKDPSELYELLEARTGTHVDRCVLYAYKCAVYYADGGREPEKLKWWNWKDEGE